MVLVLDTLQLIGVGDRGRLWYKLGNSEIGIN